MGAEILVFVDFLIIVVSARQLHRKARPQRVENRFDGGLECYYTVLLNIMRSPSVCFARSRGASSIITGAKNGQ